MTTAEQLILEGREDDITAVYEHYEWQEPAPKGVELKGSFTETMGRVWDCSKGAFTIL